MVNLPLDKPVLTAPWKKPAADLLAIAPKVQFKGHAQEQVKPAQPPPAEPVAQVKPAQKRKKAQAATPAEPPPPPPPPPPPKAPEEPLEIVENGSHVPIPLPFQPVSPLEILASTNTHVLGVMLRQLRDMKAPQPDTSNGALAVMRELSDGFKHGKDVTPQMNAVAVHLTGRGDRRELIAELEDVLDDERKIEIFVSRAKFEDFLHSCQRRSDVSIIEGIAIQQYFNGELDKIFSRRTKRSSGDLVTGREPHELVAKANLPTQLHRKELQHKFNEASPQEREILRKLGFKVQSMVAARISRTTTETVELVEDDGTRQQ
jgi:hypothetical protein